VAVTPASLKEDLPEFSSVADATVQKWLDRVAKMMNPDHFGDIYDDSHLQLAAHWMAVSGLGTGIAVAGSAIKSKTVGPVSVTYESATTLSEAEAELERTKYGRLFKALRRTRPRSPMVL
jgi:hypothetical protein